RCPGCGATWTAAHAAPGAPPLQPPPIARPADARETTGAQPAPRPPAVANPAGVARPVAPPVAPPVSGLPPPPVRPPGSTGQFKAPPLPRVADRPTGPIARPVLPGDLPLATALTPEQRKKVEELERLIAANSHGKAAYLQLARVYQ